MVRVSDLLIFKPHFLTVAKRASITMSCTEDLLCQMAGMDHPLGPDTDSEKIFDPRS